MTAYSPLKILALSTLFVAPATALEDAPKASLPVNELVGPEKTAAEWALQTYGPKILFTVHRKGKNIGTHSVDLQRTEQNSEIHINSSTQLRVKFLFFTAYKLDYRAREEWDAQGLTRVYSKTNDGGEKSEYDKTPDQIQATMVSNHWNPYVTGKDQVYNTLTGADMDVTITNKGLDSVESWGGDIVATRYDYSGDLNDVSVWYDQKGRWVGLQFKGTDGSSIIYKCKKCGQS